MVRLRLLGRRKWTDLGGCERVVWVLAAVAGWCGVGVGLVLASLTVRWAGVKVLFWNVPPGEMLRDTNDVLVVIWAVGCACWMLVGVGEVRLCFAAGSPEGVFLCAASAWLVVDF